MVSTPPADLASRASLGSRPPTVAPAPSTRPVGKNRWFPLSAEMVPRIRQNGSPPNGCRGGPTKHGSPATKSRKSAPAQRPPAQGSPISATSALFPVNRPSEIGSVSRIPASTGAASGGNHCFCGGGSRSRAARSRCRGGGSRRLALDECLLGGEGLPRQRISRVGR